jgi:hypothetical protein
MFTLLKRCDAKDLVFVQGPSFLVALVIAEMFYKFHSFLLETAAFLATWFVLDVLITKVFSLFRPREIGVEPRV